MFTVVIHWILLVMHFFIELVVFIVVCLCVYGSGYMLYLIYYFHAYFLEMGKNEDQKVGFRHLISLSLLLLLILLTILFFNLSFIP